MKSDSNNFDGINPPPMEEVDYSCSACDKLQAELESKAIRYTANVNTLKAELEKTKIKLGNTERDFADFKRSREECLDWSDKEIARLKGLLLWWETYIDTDETIRPPIEETRKALRKLKGETE